jgi:hypothetical protein
MSLGRRVTTAAEQTLARQHFVAPVDVLGVIGWLTASHVDRWRKGQADELESCAAVGSGRLLEAVEVLRQWAQQKGLVPAEVEYVAATRDRRALRFTVDGNEDVELLYRTHWMPAAMPAAERERMVHKQSAAPDLVVVEPLKDFTCTSCAQTGSLLVMEDAGPICMMCADLDHLVFLPSGDAALTRRAKKASTLSAVVVRFSRSRKRYERQGLLVQPQALDLAEEQCLADQDVRLRRAERDRIRREHGDAQFTEQMEIAIVGLFPGCPPERAATIARHTSVRGSGRVGRSAAGRALDDAAVTAAVVASVRHTDTAYDELLMSGVPRADARDQVRPRIDEILDRWRRGDA